MNDELLPADAVNDERPAADAVNDEPRLPRNRGPKRRGAREANAPARRHTAARGLLVR